MERKAYTGPHQITLPAWISPAPFEKLLAMEIVQASEGEALLTMPFLASFSQGVGLMHGGALASLADTALAMAIKSILTPGTCFVTLDMANRFLYPVKKGTLQARARIVECEGAVIKGQCEVLDDEGRTVMTSASVFKVTRSPETITVYSGDGSQHAK